MPLPPDWQPNDKSSRLAVEQLGEIGAANLLAKFRSYYSDDPKLRTATQWQTMFCDWIETQRSPPASPLLPLVASTPLESRDSSAVPRGWQPGMPTDDELRKKWSVAL